MSVFYVLDVHKGETVFLSELTFSISGRKGKKGRTPTTRQPDTAPIQLQHMALVLMASLYIMRLKLLLQEETPLLSVRDAKILVIAINFCTQKEVDMCMEQMNIRHKQRQADIDRRYKF